MKVVHDSSYSVSTFSFYMIRDDNGFSNDHLTSISMNLGTPTYWYPGQGFGLDEEIVKDKIEIIL